MENVIYEVKENIAIITMNRPKALNALNPALLNDFNEALTIAEKDDDVRVIIVTGAGRAFVAGADISLMVNMYAKEGMAYLELGQGIYRHIEKIKKPVIAAINGFALGGGCELSMACDLRIASTKAVFALPEVGLGIMPGYGGTQRMARLIGDAKAKEMIFTAQQIKADEAYRIGLLNKVVEPEELMDAAMDMARIIASKAPIAVALAKESVNRGRQVDIDSAMSLECMYATMLFSTEDLHEGMRAFLEKRPAVFQNK